MIMTRRDFLKKMGYVVTLMAVLPVLPSLSGCQGIIHCQQHLYLLSVNVAPAFVNSVPVGQDIWLVDVDIVYHNLPWILLCPKK